MVVLANFILNIKFLFGFVAHVIPHDQVWTVWICSENAEIVLTKCSVDVV